jgi:sterol desaturase/sphingolipid hydroxylase (fatty acid hydroxylase superfamily)
MSLLSASSLAGLLLPFPLSTFAKVSLLPAAPPPGSPVPQHPECNRAYEEEPVASLHTHLAVLLSGAWKLLFAAAVLAWQPLDRAAAAALEPSWLLTTVLRDLAITLAVGCAWDWLHLAPASPLFTLLARFKFMPGRYPAAARLSHDAMWACASSLVASAWEVALLHAWATGRLSLQASLPAATGGCWWLHPATVGLLLALPHFQIIHFFAIHRLMHRWGPLPAWLPLPDLGAWLYTHVHSLHHKSRDPTAFSGISMHPVESALFFSTMGCAALLGAHPIVLLHCKFFNIVTAMVGHESFGDPSTGGHSHWLHHQLVNCNYGGSFVPLDYWLGSYVRNEEDFERKFGQRKKE